MKEDRTKGESTLIGNAGEYYVVAELLKRRIIAALTPRNMPAWDVLAMKQDRTVKIRVKTKTERYDVWQWSIKKDGEIFRFLQEKDDFIVLVNLTDDTRNMDYFILPTSLLNTWLIDEFNDWVSAPGAKGQQHALSNPKRNLEYAKSQSRLEPYRNKWSILWEAS